MGELLQQPNPELAPNPHVVELLRGEISDPLTTISQKPGVTFGHEVTVRIAQEGPGLLGLTDPEDNKEWSGIFNHTMLVTRGAVNLAERMAQNGYPTNPQQILDAGIVSHAGRRQWDEARWYPNIVPHAHEKRQVSNEILGLQMIQGKVDQPVFDLVAALGHEVEGFDVDPEVSESLDYKLMSYVDHRTTDRYKDLHTRMGDFLLQNFFPADSKSPELQDTVYNAMKYIIESEKGAHFGATREVTLDHADAIVKSLQASSESARLSRRDFMRLVLQDAKTEAILIEAGIDPYTMNDETIPMPKWEDNLRKEYVNSINTDQQLG